MSAQHSEKKTGPRARRSRPAVLILMALLIVVGAAGGTAWYIRSSRHQAEMTDVSADVIKGAPPMPDWLSSASPLIKTEYAWAATHLNELQYIPCYCGCNGAGHTDNFACYYQRDAGGKILGYDQMSFT